MSSLESNSALHAENHDHKKSRPRRTCFQLEPCNQRLLVECNDRIDYMNDTVGCEYVEGGNLRTINRKHA